MKPGRDAPGVLVTGGLGYIGSHTVVALAEAGYRVVVVDDLSNSSIDVLAPLEALCGRSVPTYCGDVRDREFLALVLARNPVACAVHFAGLKAVGDSVRMPFDYYDVNINGTLTLARALASAGVRRMVFSSSATVYGDPAVAPTPETHPLAPANPYGRTKRDAEELLADLCASDPEWGAISLRYFNPAGAHPSGTIGERPQGVPNNLLPFIAQVASGERPVLCVFGDDYPTPDGTGVRDYVHVADLADAHVSAVARVLSQPGNEVINLGSGRGYSVLDVVRAYERANEVRIQFEIVSRRPGDVARYLANPARAEQLLDWRATRGIDDMCRDAARFQRMHVERAPRPMGAAASLRVRALSSVPGAGPLAVPSSATVG